MYKGSVVFEVQNGWGSICQKSSWSIAFLVYVTLKFSVLDHLLFQPDLVYFVLPLFEFIIASFCVQRSAGNSVTRGAQITREI